MSIWIIFRINKTWLWMLISMRSNLNKTKKLGSLKILYPLTSSNRSSWLEKCSFSGPRIKNCKKSHLSFLQNSKIKLNRSQRVYASSCVLCLSLNFHKTFKVISKQENAWTWRKWFRLLHHTIEMIRFGNEEHFQVNEITKY